MLPSAPLEAGYARRRPLVMKSSRSLIFAVTVLACASAGAIAQQQRTSGPATALPAGGFGGMRGDGPAPKPKPFGFTRADPAFDALVSRDAKVELVASGFKLNEGTTWVRERGGGGFLLVAG